jgi:hypothetical protein
MQKAIYIENTGKVIERILSVAEPQILENNPTGRNYILVEDFVEEPELQTPTSINYPMYNTQTGEVLWIQIDYKNTAPPELLEIENLKAENKILNENINTLTEALADMIGGAI